MICKSIFAPKAQAICRKAALYFTRQFTCILTHIAFFVKHFQSVLKRKQKSKEYQRIGITFLIPAFFFANIIQILPGGKYFPPGRSLFSFYAFLSFLNTFPKKVFTSSWLDLYSQKSKPETIITFIPISTGIHQAKTSLREPIALLKSSPCDMLD